MLLTVLDKAARIFYIGRHSATFISISLISFHGEKAFLRVYLLGHTNTASYGAFSSEVNLPHVSLSIQLCSRETQGELKVFPKDILLHEEQRLQKRILEEFAICLVASLIPTRNWTGLLINTQLECLEP
jgi:hypothetical protein